MRRIPKFVIIALVVSLGFAAWPQKLYAEEGPKVVISPAEIDLDLDPGESTSFKLTVVNTSSIDRTFEVKLRSFDEGGKAGEPVLDDTIETPLHEWLQLPTSTIQVTSQSHIVYEVNLSIPLSARPGSYRTVLLFRDTEVHTDVNGSIISAEFGPFIFVKVNGKLVEQAEILNFQAKQVINESLPVAFTTLISNQGNVDIVPRGTINIRPLYSLNTQQRNFDFNPTLSRTLADSQRVYTSEWIDGANWQIGYYEAEIVFAYSDSNKVLTTKTNFWIIPWKVLIVILIIVTCGFTFSVHRSRRKSNRTPKPAK